MKSRKILAIALSFMVSMTALATLCTAITLMQGCQPVTSTTPPQAIAPGYTSSQDQTFGQALAAAHAFALQATTDYGKLSPAQQQTERNALNGFVAAVNAADAVYLAFHQSQATAAQVQTALNQVNTAQANYTAITTGGK